MTSSPNSSSSTTTCCEDLFYLLSSPMKLERDRGLTELESRMNEQIHFRHFVTIFWSRLRESNLQTDPWQRKLALMLSAKEIGDHYNAGDHDIMLDNDVIVEKGQFCSEVIRACLVSLTDDEVRVRSAAGEALAPILKRNPTPYKDLVEDTLLDLIRSNLARSVSTPETPSSDIFHDTAGWRHLETSVKCLQRIIEEITADVFVQHGFLDSEVVGLIFETLRNVNRFVRETGFYTVACIVDSKDHESRIKIDVFGDQFAEVLSQGLSDNWSQVRMAACVATRKFLLARQDDPSMQRYLPILLPRLCLNRYYLAEGVRIYSQETWKKIVGNRGKNLVERYLVEIVEYYSDMTSADNHAVREAACQCIAELAIKVDAQELKPFVSDLLSTLVKCFKDDSWPVRDAACVACGSFVLCYPELTKKSFHLLKPLFLENLKDPISSVRQGASVALSNCVKAFGREEILDPLIPVIKASFKDVRDQPQELAKSDEGTSELSRFGVADKRIRDNDVSLHENQVMYSCGSLAPKMSRGGCSSASFRKPSEPWEKADGFVHFIAECSSQYPELIASLLPDVSDSTRFRHYGNHYNYIETVVKLLPKIAQRIGKKLFKPVLELFLEPIFYALRSDHQLASVGAEYCVRELSSFLGPNIFRGRVEQYDPSYLIILDGLGESSTDYLSRPIDIPIKPVSLGGTPTGSPTRD